MYGIGFSVGCARCVEWNYARTKAKGALKQKGKQFKWLPLTGGVMMFLVLPLVAVDGHRI